MSILEKATRLECKKDGLAQLQCGDWVLKLKIQAADIPTAILTAPMGTRYAIGMVEIGDDEKPVEKPDHRLSQQAAICCGEPLFWRFLEGKRGWSPNSVSGPEEAARGVRHLTLVDSRSEFDRSEQSAARWRDLHAQFEAWKKI